LTWQQARDVLRKTADRIDTAGGSYQNGYSLKYGHGRLNAQRAVERAQKLAAGPPSPKTSKKASKSKKSAKKVTSKKSKKK
jgi:hypothetical protein